MSGLPNSYDININERKTPPTDSYFDYEQEQNAYTGDFTKYGEGPAHVWFKQREDRRTPRGVQNPSNPSNASGPNNPPPFDPANPQAYYDWWQQYGQYGGAGGGLPFMQGYGYGLGDFYY